MDSEQENTSEHSQAEDPAQFLYHGLQGILEEFNAKALELTVLVLTLWEIGHVRDQTISTPPIEEWIEILRWIKSPPQNPLEEFQEAQ